MNDRPVILSYFAQSQGQDHLDLLQEERDSILDAWAKANIQSPNPLAVDLISQGTSRSTTNRIIEDIKTYGRRIVLFQFSGHAGPDAIQLNDGAGGPNGIAELLKAYAPNLKVVVLNGCSTRSHVEILFENGISAVVATSSAVNDKHATQFAIAFHQTLCEGKSIQDAFRVAIAVLKIKKLDHLLPPELSTHVVNRSMLGASHNSGTFWGLFTQDTENTSVTNPYWWSIGGHANQPPANFYEASQYQDLKSQLDTLNNDYATAKGRVSKYPDDIEFQTDLLRIDDKRRDIQHKIDSLKQQVLKLADEFNQIPLNTERLQVAKAHFDAGDYEKARAIFDTEAIGSMAMELDDLLEQAKELADAVGENRQNLLDKANEYLILARLTALNFSITNRIEQTNTCFDQSLKADRKPETLFAYAYFLQQHNLFNRAQPMYEEVLQIIRPLIQTDFNVHAQNLAHTLNQLATLYTKTNKFQQALPIYEEALRIRKQLARDDSPTFLSDLAYSMTNLANLLVKIKKSDEALILYEEALRIRKQLAFSNQLYLPNVAYTLNNLADVFSSNSQYNKAMSLYHEALQRYEQLAQENQTYQPNVAYTLNNLADLFAKTNKLDMAQALYEKALLIRSQLAEVNVQTYLPHVVHTLNSLANLFVKTEEYDKAQTFYTETIEIRRQLAIVNAQAYLPNLAMTAINIGHFYQQNCPIKSMSLAYAAEALRATLPFTGNLPRTDRYARAALQIAEAWGEDKDEFLHKIIAETKLS